MDPRDGVERLLRNCKARLLRSKTHLVWLLPTGRRWVIPKSPSDSHAWRNNFQELRKVLGIRLGRKKRVNGGVRKLRSVLTPPKEKLAPARPRGELGPPVYRYRVPARVQLKRGPVHPSAASTRKGHSLGTELIAEANRVLKEKGEEGLSEFLRQVKSHEK
mgnify:CR=1 FL=1